MPSVDLDHLRVELHSILQDVLESNLESVCAPLRQQLRAELEDFYAKGPPAWGAWPEDDPARGGCAEDRRPPSPPSCTDTGHEWLSHYVRGFPMDTDFDDDDGWVTEASEKQAPTDRIFYGAKRAAQLVLTANRVNRMGKPMEFQEAVLPETMAQDARDGAAAAANLPGRVLTGDMYQEPASGPWVAAEPSHREAGRLGADNPKRWSITPQSAPGTGLSAKGASSRALSVSGYRARKSGSVMGGLLPQSFSRGPRHKQCIAKCVQSIYFEYIICLLVVANVVTIGVQIDHVARNFKDAVPPAFAVIEYTFCCIFLIEILLRLYTYRCRFFTSRGWRFNVMDLMVVIMQFTEMILEGGSKLSGESSSTMPTNLTFLRIFRIVRWLRIIRLVRILRHIRELRTLIVSIITSLKSLLWTLILLVVIIYTISLYLTQIVSDHRNAHADEHFGELEAYYGDLCVTMLSMFEALFGGQDWHVLLVPLVDHIHPWLAVLFCFYIAFSLLAMMNVVTGVFVDNVLECTRRDKDHFLINNVRELFSSVEGGGKGVMNWEVFQSKLDCVQMQEAFKAINVDPSEARGLFRLLDLDNSGVVNAEEFLSGCLRLRGPAKALDLHLLLHEVKQLQQRPTHRAADSDLGCQRQKGYRMGTGTSGGGPSTATKTGCRRPSAERSVCP